jgi:hypothetical protein
MSRSDWSKFNHPATVVVAVVIFGLSLLATWDLSASHTQNSIDAEKYSAKYAEHAEQEIERSCIGADRNISLECVYEIVKSTNDAQNAEDDLTAQNAMARAALWMLAVGACSIFLTMIGIYFVRENLTEMGRQRKVSEDTFVAQTRPWLSFNSTKLLEMIIDNTQVRVKVGFLLENVGASPALAVSVTPRLSIDPFEVFRPKNTRRNPSLAINQSRGATIFNGKEWPYPVSFGISMADITKSHQEWVDKIIALKPEPGVVESLRQSQPSPHFWVIANVQYEFFGSDRVHQTSVQFMIWKRKPGGTPSEGESIPMTEGILDLTHIELMPVGDVLAD